jgi:hypothetical protein
MGLRWAGASGPLFKMQGEKQMVRCKARLRIKTSYEMKSAGEG